MADISNGGAEVRRPRHWKRKLEAIKQEYQSKLVTATVPREEKPPETIPLPQSSIGMGKQFLEAFSFLGMHLCSWTAILFIVAGLWAFGTLMLQVPNPTLVDFAIGEALFVAANVILFGKIAWATYRSDLGRLGFAVVVLASFVVLGGLASFGMYFFEGNKPQDQTSQMNLFAHRLSTSGIPKPPNEAFVIRGHSISGVRPPRMQVTRYVTLPYEVGKPLKVKMYVDNLGDSELLVTGGTHSKLIDKVPSDFNERRRLEQALWEEMKSLALPKDQYVAIPVQPRGGFFVELESYRELTQADIDRLANGGAMYLLSYYKDSQAVNRIQSCIRTTASRDSVLYCLDPDHNSDDINSRPAKRDVRGK